MSWQKNYLLNFFWNIIPKKYLKPAQLRKFIPETSHFSDPVAKPKTKKLFSELRMFL